MEKANIKSAIVELEERLVRNNVSEDDLSELTNEFHECFGEMSNVQRVALLKRFWQLDHEITIVDKSTNCLYSSSPLFRAFTISHEQLIRQHQIEHGDFLDSSDKVSVAAKELKQEIASMIKKSRGEVKTEAGPMLSYEDRTETNFSFLGFQPGLASDDYVIGMFFSEADREKAIQDVVMKWGNWGVRTEPLAEDRGVHSKRYWFWKQHFDRKQFRRQFKKLSHEERLDAIDDLDAKGIDFTFTEHAPYTCYESSWHSQGSIRNSRCFSYDFDLGYLPENGNPFELPENFPSAEERRKEIDETERTLLHLIAKHGGFVTSIKRRFDDAVVSPQESEEFLSSGDIHARFPS